MDPNEQFYLGAILVDGSWIDEARLTPEHFVHGEHRSLYKEMLRMRDEGEAINLGSFSSMSETKLNAYGGLKYVMGLAMGCPSDEGFASYENALIHRNMHLKASRIAHQYIYDTEAGSNPKALDKLIRSVNAIETKSAKKALSFAELIAKRNEEHLRSPELGSNGVSTGFNDLDRTMDSYSPGDLIILGARPSMGKTAFALNSMINQPESVMPTFFSIEMAEGQVIDRMIASIGKINLMKMKNPNRYFRKDGTDWEKYQAAIATLSRMPYSLRTENTVPEMRAVVRKNIKENPDHKHIVFIDFLTMIRTDEKSSRHHEIEDIILSLKRMATELNIPVVVLAQLSRALEQRQDKRPMLSDLRESGSIEQTADIVLFLYRDDYYDGEGNGHTEVIIAKNRNGPIGKVDLIFTKETNTFQQVYRGG